MKFEISKSTLFIDSTAASGVKKIAAKVAEDINLVTGKKPECVEVNAPSKGVNVSTLGLGFSDSLLTAEEKDVLASRREAFCFKVTEDGLTIVGSDKRGTIYGLFHISELMKVSPWVNYADVLPQKQDEVIFTEADNCISKQPSVKYRGIFINDEWPAFGNWCMEHFGGVNAKMYDLIFETILRLKGNYLWPAMWASNFTLDGPGEDNAILADEYGIVMSNSHHEPCLRHSEEWDMLKGPDTIYGTDWSYITNKPGLLNYWRDGLKRSGKYENIITIGMRGERDSMMLGEDSTLKENIDLLKDIITEQRKLIAEHVNPDEPQMLALYKEVERYFYGNEGAHDGLKDWDGLDGVTFMLCEDNFGNLRTLPTEDVKNRKGGWGLYYHFDYHGGPISYEWVNTSYLPKVWDQLCEAYEFGIQDIWIVNVGDFKFNEYPVSFFMDLAYDYEKWGISNLNSADEYMKVWAKDCFPEFNAEETDKLIDVMKGYTKLAHNRKTEALNPDVYNPVHFNESERVLETIAGLEAELMELKNRCTGDLEAKFWELVYYPAMGVMNVYKLNIFAGLNKFYANIGALVANDYADKMKACLQRDTALTNYMHGIKDGKWNPMGASKHIFFRNWNEEECVNPVLMYVEPVDKPAAYAYVKDVAKAVTAGGDWTRKLLRMDTFERPDVSEGEIVLLNAGNKHHVPYVVECNNAKVKFTKSSEEIETVNTIKVCVAPEDRKEDIPFVIKYANNKINCLIPAVICSDAAAGIFVEDNGVVTIEAEHFASAESKCGGEFKVIPEYGKTLSGIKAFPVNKIFAKNEGPTVTYKFAVRESGEYEVNLYTAPANPITQWDRVEFGLKVNDGEVKEIPLIPENYMSGEPSEPRWAKMVLDQIRIITESITLNAGENELTVQAIKPGFILEKVVINKANKKAPESYLGPDESYRK